MRLWSTDISSFLFFSFRPAMADSRSSSSSSDEYYNQEAEHLNVYKENSVLTSDLRMYVHDFENLI